MHPLTAGRILSKRHVSRSWYFHSFRNLFTDKRGWTISTSSTCWCSYKDVNRGSGGISTCFVGRSKSKFSPITVNRRLSTTGTISLSGKNAADIKTISGGIELRTDNDLLTLPFIWLRDHCRCQICYNYKTNQKKVENLDCDLSIEPRSVEYDGVQLSLIWPDDHKTTFETDWLLSHVFHSGYKKKVPFFLWNKDVMTANPPPRIGYEDHMNTSMALKRSIFNILKFGYTIVTQVPLTIEDTREVIEKVSPVSRTLFGEMWSFTSDEARGDTAYTNIALGAHTDASYYNIPAGIQVFHCLEHDGSGGETLLLDGFNAAERLQKIDPAAFDILTRTVIPHEYIEPGHNFHSLGTVLTQHPTTGEMLNIRFNPYDRAPLYTVPPDKVQEFYRAYQALSTEIKNKDNEFWIKLEPGMVLFIDNWRVLHGRAAFTGKRVITGCYLSRDDLMSTARVLQIL
ncbi:hypothetical protein ScPMuIL_017414 [Solemya velum]